MADVALRFMDETYRDRDGRCSLSTVGTNGTSKPVSGRLQRMLTVFPTFHLVFHRRLSQSLAWFGLPRFDPTKIA
jgi:hypothetical protein